MSQRVIGSGQTDMSETSPVDEVEGLAASAAGDAQIVQRAHPTGAGRLGPSYVPTGIAIVDAGLAKADDITHGKAGLLQRAVTYLMIGGFAAVVNLVCLVTINDFVPMPFSTAVRFNVAFVVAAEISIMANFIPNDKITFSHLPGHARSWWHRCWRFHSTAIAGTIITYIISSFLYLSVHLPSLFAEAIAIIIALIFNFTFHHLWTYRHVGPEH